MDFGEILKRAVTDGASDLFLVAGGALSERVHKRVLPLTEGRLSAQDCEHLVAALYRFAERSMDTLKQCGDDKFSFSAQGLARFRVSAYLQRGSMAAVIRIVAFGIPKAEDLGIPEQVLALADEASGLILIAGAERSGKSTTLACLTDRINQRREGHIVTIEDPIEYLHRDQKCLISQREVGIDTDSFQTALLFALQQSPDVIMLSEMRGTETIQTALMAAEAGNLVFAVLHTQGAANTVERLVKAFPAEQRETVREQLGTSLRAVISQQLLPCMDGGLAPAFEILYADPAVRPIICEGNTTRLAGVIAVGNIRGMLSMDQSILNLYQKKRIRKETALKYASDPELMKRKLWIIGG